jgi:hypothetical protein
MTMRILLPAIAALALSAAAPASAQMLGPFGDEQGGGGAGPYTPNCKFA